MKRMFLSLLLTLGMSALAFGAPHADDADHTAPSYDLKGQSLVDLDALQKKFVDLANAVPADKLTWRPSADSRSFAEVFLHVAGERYQILHLIGTEFSVGIDGKTYAMF